MKTILTLLTSVLLTFTSFAQMTIKNEYPAWGQPIIKKLIAKDTSVTGYGLKSNDKFINIAILDKKEKMLYWISCEGYIIEAVNVTDVDYASIIKEKLDPFQLHQLLYKRDIQVTDDAIQKFRFPTDKFYSKLNPNYDQYIVNLLHSKKYDTFKTPIQKLAALYKSDQEYFFRMAYLEAGHPLKAHTDSIYEKYLANVKKGRIVVSGHTDSSGSAEFYNRDGLSPIYKAALNIFTAKLYFYHSNQTIFDSLTVRRKQILQLIDEGTDVFTLYRNFILWQLTALDSTVKEIGNYYSNKKISSNQRKATEILLISFGGGKEALVEKLHQAEAVVLAKLNDLFGVDINYLEQNLWKDFANTAKPIRYGEYIEGIGLVLATPTIPPIQGTMHKLVRGNTLYQLTDHRGNVNVIVTDKKIPHDDNGDGIVDYYTADVVKATDYSSFGAPLSGRSFEIREYRYEYNGKEDDKETGYQNYGFRMYDPNIARFISVDPLTKKYPWYSPYQFAGNSPIKFIDVDGAEPVASRQELQNIRLTNSVVKGDIISGKYDPKDMLHVVDVERVFDPIKKQSYFIHKENNTSYYWNSTENTLRIHWKADGSVESNGAWEKYETYEQRRSRVGGESADFLSGFFAGGSAAIAAAPLAIAAAPTIATASVAYGSEAVTAGLGSRLISAGANTTFQYIQNAPNLGFGLNNLQEINVTSIGLSLLNPAATFTNAVGGNFGKITYENKFSEAIGGSQFNLKNAAIGTAIDYGGGKLSDALGLKAGVYGGMNKLQSQAVGDVLSGAVSTPVNTIIDQSQKKNP